MSRKPAPGPGSSASHHDTDQKRARRGQVRKAVANGTVERILDGARRILIDYGYAEFTTRRVAEVVGMTVGNLTYHFPSKRELLRALIAKLLADYGQRFESFFPSSDNPQGPMIESLIRWAFTDTIAVETVRTMRELWALALHDASNRRAVDDFYDEMMNGVVQLLQQKWPQADVRRTRELVQLMVSISEGLNVLYGTRLERVVPHERMVDLAVGLVGVIAPDLQRAPGTSDGGSGVRKGSRPRSAQSVRVAAKN